MAAGRSMEERAARGHKVIYKARNAHPSPCFSPGSEARRKREACTKLVEVFFSNIWKPSLRLPEGMPIFCTLIFLAFPQAVGEPAAVFTPLPSGRKAIEHQKTRTPNTRIRHGTPCRSREIRSARKEKRHENFECLLPQYALGVSRRGAC